MRVSFARPTRTISSGLVPNKRHASRRNVLTALRNRKKGKLKPGREKSFDSVRLRYPVAACANTFGPGVKWNVFVLWNYKIEESSLIWLMSFTRFGE